MSKRAERRHHHNRMLKKVKKFSLYQSYFWTEEEKIKHQRKMAETRHPCSCASCCNQRRNKWAKGERLTMQERRMQEYDKE